MRIINCKQFRHNSWTSAFHLAPEECDECANRLGMVPLSDIILNLSACLVFLSANGPEANGEEDLANVIPRALADEDNGDVCRLELRFGDEGEL